MYLIFALFSGLLGTAFSVLIRLELSGPGVQFISNNQLYNSIITAHALLMSTPLCLEMRSIRKKGSTKENSCVKNCQAGRAELYGETQTAKLIGKGVNGSGTQDLGLTPNLLCATFRLTNLNHVMSFIERNLAERVTRANALFPLILSLVLELFSTNNGTPHIEENNYARNRAQNAASRNYGITYGNPKSIKVPKNQGLTLGPLLGGDGVAVIGHNIRRATVSKLQVRTLSSKAGSDAIRGSEDENTLMSITMNIKAISNLKNLVTAYELIKSNPGNMTKGADEVTLDGINLKHFLKLQSELRAGKFEFTPARRIQIPKPGKNETRPLTIASPREKIVQKAILLILEGIYESKFLETSRGFRPARGTHTAMKQLESNFQSAQYIIEADFSKAFDSIQHDALMSILKEDIECEKTLRLIKSGLKAGYFEFGELHNNLSSGTPQGSILSPLLCNIFLHKLDKYIEQLKKEHQKGEKRIRSKENMRLQNKAKY